MALFIVLFIAVGAASATDINVNDADNGDNLTVSTVDTIANLDNDLEVNNDENLDSVLDNQLSDSDKNEKTSDSTPNTDTSFTQLKKDITTAVGVLNLEHDYCYVSTDSKFVKGINITKNLIINGNNYVIDGSNLARVFYIPYVNDYQSIYNVTINNLTFINCFNNEVYDKGGAIGGYAKSLNLSNCNFINCHTNYINCYGGAISNIGSLSCVNCSFVNCSAIKGCGGAISVDTDDGNDVNTISGSTFTNCSAGSNGGAIKGSALNVTGSTFTNCSSSSSNYYHTAGGGAISVDNGNAVNTISDSNFTNCKTNGSNGVIFNGGNLTVSGSIFINCIANNCCAIYNDEKRILTVYGSIFDNYTSSKGTIYIYSGNYDLDGNYWGRNFANISEFEAAGLIKNAAGNVTVNDWINLGIVADGDVSVGEKCDFNVSFSGTVADYTVSVNGTEVTIPSGNVGVYNYTPTVAGDFNLSVNSAYSGNKLLEKTFTATQAINNSFTDLQKLIDDNYGKTLVLDNNYTRVTGDPDLVIDDTITIDANGFTINGNNLGGIFKVNSNANLTLKNAILINGEGIDVYREGTLGGAIYVTSSNLIIENVSFINNSAVKGGAICSYNGNGNITITNARFVNNIAKEGYGGAIYMRTDSPTLTATNVSFINNSAVNGGAINANRVILYNASFVNNTASSLGDSVVCWQDPSSISGCEFTNKLSNHSQIYLMSGDLTLSNNTFDVKDNIPCITVNKWSYSNKPCIVSNVSATVMNNQTVDVTRINSYLVEVTFCDDKGNSIAIVNPKATISIGGHVYDLINNGTVYYVNVSTVDIMPGSYVVNTTSSALTNLTVQTGTLNVNPRYDFTELQALIKDNYGKTLVLENNYTRFDGDPNLVINGTITIDANGYTINGNNLGGIFNVTSTGNLTLNNLTITNCKDTYSNSGGAIYNNGNVTVTGSDFINCSSSRYGGAICSFGNLNVSDCDFENCFAIGTEYYNFGGAIFSFGNASVSGSTFTDCKVNDFGGAIYNEKGGSFNVTNLTVCDCSVAGSAGRGGAICNAGSFYANSLTVCDCSVAGSAGRGGAIYNEGSFSVTSLDISNCSATNKGSGGAIYNIGRINVDVLNITDCSATYDGAIYNCGSFNVTNLTVYNCTTTRVDDDIIANQYLKASYPGIFTVTNLVIDNCTSNYIIYNTGTLNIRNGVLNISNYYSNNGVLNLNNCSVVLSNSTFMQNKNTAIVVNESNLTVVGSIFDKIVADSFVDAKSGDLALDGNFWGKNYYNAADLINDVLIVDSGVSVALDDWVNLEVIGDNSVVLDGVLTFNATFKNINGLLASMPVYEVNITNLDQSSIVNITDDGYSFDVITSDVGRYDVVVYSTYSNNIVTTKNYAVTNDTNSFAYLEIEIKDAIAKGGVLTLTHDYVFNDGCDFGSGILIDGDLVINGNGFTMDGNNLARLFNITSGGNLTLSDVTLKGGNATSRGGAIYSNGDLSITDCTFTGNYAVSYGGVIYSNGSYANIANCDFVDNCAGVDGGAIFLNCYDSSVTDCTFDGNSVKGRNNSHHGGAVYICSNVTEITDCTFTNNFATDNGGALYVDSGNLNLNPVISRCTFTNNTAGGVGGVILFYGGSPIISDCTFDNNNASSYGGAISNYAYNLTVSNLTISNCSADRGAAIYNSVGANLTVSDLTISNCSAGVNGGAIYNYRNATLTTVGSLSIMDCTAENGAGIYNKGILNIANGIFIGNNATNGSAIYIDDGDVTVNGCIFDNNVVNNGTVYIENGSYDLDGNYWGMNFDDADDFKESNLIIDVNESVAPDNWAYLDVVGKTSLRLKDVVTYNIIFKLCYGNGTITDFTGDLPDYVVSVSVVGKSVSKNANVTISDGVGYYKPYTSAAGSYKLTVSSIYSNEDLTSMSYTVINYVTIKEILTASNYVKKYAKAYKKLPSTVKIGSVKCTMAQYSYLASAAVKYLNAKKSVATKIKVITVKATNKNTKVYTKAYKKQYLKTVNTLYAKGAKGTLPSYVTINSKKVGFNIYTFGLAKILAFYNSKARLPNYVIFTSSYS